jgi:hypothetical protein
MALAIYILYAGGKENKQITEHVKINHSKGATIRVKTRGPEMKAGRTWAKKKTNSEKSALKTCVISGFRRDVDEIWDITQR